MTQGDKRPEPFRKGQRLTAAGLNELTTAIESVMGRMLGQSVGQPLDISGKLDGDLAPASDFGTGPATATMSVWDKDTNGNMVDTGRNETIVNRFLRISVPTGTIVEAKWLNGEWRLAAADCA
jgi:hypothetical protein